MTDKLIKRLQQYYPVSTEVFGLLEKRCRMMELKKHDIIISADKTDDNIYIVQDGLLRSYYIDSKGNEVTQYFGMEGDLFTSMFSYYNREPAFLQVEAVTDMTLYAIRKKDIEALCSISIEAANWFRHVCLEQLYCLEKRTKVFGKEDAMARYKSLIKARPDILKEAPLKHIASYLGITQQTLSRLRAQLASEKAEGQF